MTSHTNQEALQALKTVIFLIHVWERATSQMFIPLGNTGNEQHFFLEYTLQCKFWEIGNTAGIVSAE